MDIPGCSTGTNHAVLAVGYDVDTWGDEYWIVKNSWGKWWGEDGYFRIKNDGSKKGMCGINQYNYWIE